MKGNEPPHLHYDQDEVYYLLEGELEVYWAKVGRCGRAKRSSSRNQAHAFYYLSPTLGSSPCCNRAVWTGTVWTGTSKRCRVRPPAWNYRERNHMRSPAPRHRAGCQVRSQDADPAETAELLLPTTPASGYRSHLPGRDRREELLPIYSSSLSSHHLPSGSFVSQKLLGTGVVLQKI